MALIALICFFLPWIQVSCGGSKDTLSGVDLAREGHGGLWLIPILMLSVLVVSLARATRDRREISGVVTLVAGLVSAYLMNRERLRAENSTGLIAVGLTGFGLVWDQQSCWCWLPFFVFSSVHQKPESWKRCVKVTRRTRSRLNY